MRNGVQPAGRKWFTENRELIAHLQQGPYREIVLGESDTTSFCQIDDMIKDGYPGHNVGEKIDALRKLKRLLEDGRR
jgi:hypothetical protein